MKSYRSIYIIIYTHTHTQHTLSIYTSWRERERDEMERVLFVYCIDPCNERRRAIGGEFLRFNLSKRRSHCSAGCGHKVKPNICYSSGHSSSFFPRLFCWGTLFSTKNDFFFFFFFNTCSSCPKQFKIVYIPSSVNTRWQSRMW